MKKIVRGLVGGICGGMTGGMLANSATICHERGNTFLIGLDLTVTIPLGVVVGGVCGLLAAGWIQRHWHNRTRNAALRHITCLVATLAGISVVSHDLAQRPFDVPTDQELIANFERNHTAMDALAALALQDGDLYLSGGSYYLNKKVGVGLSAARVAQYKHLMKTDAVYTVQRYPGKDGVRLTYWGTSEGFDGIRVKGYVHSAQKPSPLFPSLDDKSITHGLRHITGNWYLYYEYCPG